MFKEVFIGFLNSRKEPPKAKGCVLTPESEIDVSWGIPGPVQYFYVQAAK